MQPPEILRPSREVEAGASIRNRELIITFDSRSGLVRLTYFAGHELDQLCRDADDLVVRVATGAKLIKESAGQNLGASQIGTHFSDLSTTPAGGTSWCRRFCDVAAPNLEFGVLMILCLVCESRYSVSRTRASGREARGRRSSSILCCQSATCWSEICCRLGNNERHVPRGRHLGPRRSPKANLERWSIFCTCIVREKRSDVTRKTQSFWLIGGRVLDCRRGSL